MQRPLIIVCIGVAIVVFCLCSVVYWHTYKAAHTFHLSRRFNRQPAAQNHQMLRA